MKIVCNGYDLSDAVGKVIKAAGTKTVNPVLEGIKLECFDGAIKLTATDMELAIEKTISAEVKVEGSAVVPGRLFAEFVKKLDSERVELSVFGDNKMKIRYRDSEGELNCLPVDEFPVIKKLESAQKVTFLGKNLRDIINRVSFCVSADESRPILKGVCFTVENGDVTAVATDGYRLAKCVKTTEHSDGNVSAVIPARSLNEISRLIEDDEQTISVLFQKNYVAVDLGHTCITARVLDGNYIDYRRIIPQRFETRATVVVEASSPAWNAPFFSPARTETTWFVSTYTKILWTFRRAAKWAKSTSIWTLNWKARTFPSHSTRAISPSLSNTSAANA